MPQPSPTAPGTVPAGRNSRLWGCAIALIVLALLLIVVGILARTWLAPEDASYQKDSAVSAESGAGDGAGGGQDAEESPAPEGAEDLGAIVSPSGNIQCVLDGSSVGCTIADHEIDGDAEDCAEGPFSIQVADGKVAPACDEDFEDGDAVELDYGDSATRGDVACTSEEDGMTCWDVQSGSGFTVSRSGYETF